MNKFFLLFIPACFSCEKHYPSVTLHNKTDLAWFYNIAFANNAVPTIPTQISTNKFLKPAFEIHKDYPGIFDSVLADYPHDGFVRIYCISTNMLFTNGYGGVSPNFELPFFIPVLSAGSWRYTILTNRIATNGPEEN